jgi:hypothetical protein
MTGGQPQTESVSPNTWTESGRTPILSEVSKPESTAQTPVGAVWQT